MKERFSRRSLFYTENKRAPRKVLSDFAILLTWDYMLLAKC